MTAETWFVLVDGSVVDPKEVSRDAAGALIHKGGVAVAMRGETPSSRSVDPDEERAKVARDKPPTKDREMKAEGSKPYRTRGSKAD